MDKPTLPAANSPSNSAKFAASIPLADFVAYCESRPTERFWQALRNWAGVNFILASDSKDFESRKDGAEDTFYWKGRTSGTERKV